MKHATCTRGERVFWFTWVHIVDKRDQQIRFALFCCMQQRLSFAFVTGAKRTSSPHHACTSTSNDDSGLEKAAEHNSLQEVDMKYGRREGILKTVSTCEKGSEEGR